MTDRTGPQRAGEVAPVSLYEAALASLAEGVVLADADGVVVFVNDAARRMLQVPVTTGQPLGAWGAHLSLRLPDGPAMEMSALPLAAASQGAATSSVPLVVARPDGTRLPIDSTAEPVYDGRGRLLGAVWVLRESSARLRVEGALQNLQAQHEEYVHLVSHDLRNPLTTVLGQAGWLSRRLSEQGLAREARSAESLRQAARRMNAMVQDLVDSARLEAGRPDLRLQPIEACALVVDLDEAIGTADDRARLQVECPDPDERVSVDPERIHRVLANLITNALKYSPPEGPVRVRVERQEAEVMISVSDQGPGIPPEHQARIFERFYRVPSDVPSDGMGLGLYIARMIVEAHGGRIWLESDGVPGHGCTFRFTLPAA